MRGGSICFQESNVELSKRLAEILSIESSDKLLIAIAGFKPMPTVNTPIEYWHHYWIDQWDNLKSYFKCDKYYNAFVSRVSVFADVDVDRIRKIWENRDVVFVVGRGSRFIKDPRLFDNIRSHRFIYISPKNAFNEYKKILSLCSKIPKNTLFFISAGPTATVLAYDLAILGYQALDMGHLPNCYAQYLNESPAPEKLPLVKPE